MTRVCLAVSNNCTVRTSLVEGKLLKERAQKLIRQLRGAGSLHPSLLSSGEQAQVVKLALQPSFWSPRKLFFKNPDALDKKEQQIFLSWTKGTHHVSTHLAPKPCSLDLA